MPNPQLEYLDRKKEKVWITGDMCFLCADLPEKNEKNFDVGRIARRVMIWLFSNETNDNDGK